MYLTDSFCCYCGCCPFVALERRTKHKQLKGFYFDISHPCHCCAAPPTRRTLQQNRARPSIAPAMTVPQPEGPRSSAGGTRSLRGGSRPLPENNLFPAGASRVAGRGGEPPGRRSPPCSGGNNCAPAPGRPQTEAGRPEAHSAEVP